MPRFICGLGCSRRLAGLLLLSGIILVMAAVPAHAGSIFDDNDDMTTVAPPVRPAPEVARPPVESQPSTPAPTPSPSPTVPSPEVTPSVPAPAPRRPIPATLDQAKSRKMMKQVYAKELADATASGRESLANKLIADAARLADAPADQFVVLGGAIQSASEAGDLPLALRAADQMAESYEVDPLSLRVRAALRLTPKSYRDGNIDDAKEGLALLDELQSREDFATASKLAAILQQASVKDPALRTEITARVHAIGEFKTARDKLQPALDKLKTSPNDLAANLDAGNYRVFLLHDWDGGLPYLAKGSDANLAKLAQVAIANPSDATARADLAAGWWDLAQTRHNSERAILFARASSDYQIALPGMTGLGKIQAEKRIKDACAATAAIASTLARPKNGLCEIEVTSNTSVSIERLTAGAQRLSGNINRLLTR